MPGDPFRFETLSSSPMSRAALRAARPLLSWLLKLDDFRFDSLALASAVRPGRAAVRILTNHLLSCIPELDDFCFFVDPFGGPNAVARNRAELRAAHLWLRKGGALIVFPAGEVAHERRPDGSYADSPWFPTIGRMAVATPATVVPAFIEGTNSTRLYAAGRVHPALRTALLLHSSPGIDNGNRSWARTESAGPIAS